MARKKSIVYLGYSAFPYGLAEAQKITLISRSLLLSDNRVTVICRNGTHNRASHPELKSRGTYQGIEYIYASGSAFRSNSFFRRRILEFKGKINEVLLLRKMRKKKELDFAIFSTRSFYSVLLYCFISKIYDFKTILNYVEYYSAMKKGRFQVGRKINDLLFDKFAPKLCTTSFPISEFLIGHFKKNASQKKYLKIPVLTDFDKYDGIEVFKTQNYFLFCGDASYGEIVLFIIDCFEMLKKNAAYFLYLVVSGKESDIAGVREYVKGKLSADKIKIFSKLPEKQLYMYYKNSKALLIPLRPTFQDCARFPHKTGEYLASGNPVISTNYGEMKYYFKDEDTMLLAENYDKSEFAEKMQFVIDHSEEAKGIGIRGRNLAATVFDYRSWSPIMNDFLDSAF